MIPEFRVVILAGGKGTRLRPYTLTLPKPLVPVGERPILDIVMGQLREAGVTHATLAVNHMAELIMAYFGDGQRYNLLLDYSREYEPLGTIGPLRLIADLPEHFLVMNGDVLTDLDYRKFWEDHVQSGAIASVSAYQRTIQIDFGVLDISPERRLTGFREKPTLTQMVSMGVYAFSREIIAHIPPNRAFGFDDLMLHFLEAGVEVRCCPYAGRWLDIGRPEDYERAQDF